MTLQQNLQQNEAFITFDEFLLNIGIQRQKEGSKMLPCRYIYLNRVLDILLEDSNLKIEEIYSIIAEEQNVLQEEVKQKMLIAINEIFQRRSQKELFQQIFKVKTDNVEIFLNKIIKAYKEISEE